MYICSHSATWASQFLDVPSLLQFGLLSFPPVFNTQNRILPLVISENYFCSETSTFCFPLWPRVPSFSFSFLLLSGFTHFINVSRYLLPVCYPCTSLHFSLHILLSSLDLVTLISTPCLFPWVSTTFFRQNPNPWALCLQLWCHCTKLLGSYNQNKSHFFFRKIITRSCTLVPIYSHTVMPSSLNTTYPESVSLSFTHHPFPVSILLHKVLPWIHSFFLRRWPYLLHRHPRDPMGPCVLRFLFFSPRHWSAFTPLPASPLLIHWIECIPLEENLSPFNHLLASQLPSICLLRSLVLYLFSLQVFFFF